MKKGECKYKWIRRSTWKGILKWMTESNEGPPMLLLMSFWRNEKLNYFLLSAQEKKLLWLDMLE